MRLLYDLGFWVREALRGIWRHRVMAGLSAGTMTAALLVLGTFALVRHNVSEVLRGWEEESDVSVFLREGVTPEERRAVAEALERSAAVASYRYLTKLEAIRVFEETFPTLRGIVDPESHPLPASFEVRIHPEARRTRAIDDFYAGLADLPGIDEIRDDAELREGLLSVVRSVRLGTLSLGVILLLAAAAIIFNGIRLQYESRRTEVEILRTIGATRLFLMGPYLTEGLAIGLVSGLLARLGVLGLEGWLAGFLPRVDPLVLNVRPAPLPLLPSAALVLLGALMGLAGSLFSLTRVTQSSD